MKWIVGIDEVGRGALAGPVVVAAAMLATDKQGNIISLPLRGLKDSKQMTPRQREVWARKLRTDPKVKFALARVYPRGIEKTNISAAANLAAQRAFARLAEANTLSSKTLIFLDGGLFLGSRAAQKNYQKNAKTLPKADETISAVAAASIIAKVSRDHFMIRLAKKYPGYGFEVHKGYGTGEHYRAIKKNGSCEAHRLTFLTKRFIMN